MLNRLAQLEQEAREKVASAPGLPELEKLRVRYLGKKGELTALLRSMGQLPPQERPLVGQKANALRDSLEQLLREREAVLKDAAAEQQWERERIDVTLPGSLCPGAGAPLPPSSRKSSNLYRPGFRWPPVGNRERLLQRGFKYTRTSPGPDMQDSFMWRPNICCEPIPRLSDPDMGCRRPSCRCASLLGQVYRMMTTPPIRRCSARWKACRGPGITRRLKGTLLLFAREMFGPKQRIRCAQLLSLYQPSAEVDISCIICEGLPCLRADRLAGNSGFEDGSSAGPGSRRLRSRCDRFAFGMGVERIAMLKCVWKICASFFQRPALPQAVSLAVIGERSSENSLIRRWTGSAALRQEEYAMRVSYN